MKPRVLFVGRSRYRLPLEPSLARKWDALSARLDVRVLGTGEGGDERFRLVPRLPLAAFYPALALRLVRELREFRPDVVVAQSPYEAAMVLTARALARSRAKLLLEIHGDWRTATRLYGSPLRRALEPVSERVATAAVRGADGVRVVSDFTAGLVRAQGVEPVAQFTTWFDVSAFLEQPVAPLPERPCAFFVGVLERYKNVQGLADAWRLAAPHLPDAHLQLVGRGRLTDVVERLVAEVPGQTTWTPRLEPGEVAAALDASSLLVLPSFSEGLPRVAMEAFARARPVVGSRAGGIPDIVRDGESGLLVPPGDAPALADALVRALGDRALLERLAAGAQADASRWLQSADVFAERMAEVVDALR